MDNNFKSAFLRQVPDYLALTGRVETWLNDPHNDVLPVSCTTFSVEDTMEGDSGIDDAHNYTSHGLRTAAGVALDYSKLRPNGHDNKRGLISSGPVSFMRLQSLQNEILRRGGVFKNGAVNCFLNAKHPDIIEFLNSGHLLPWAKRTVYIEDWYALSENVQNLIIEKYGNGEIFLAKVTYDENGERLFSNVCLEVLLKHRGTCLLSSYNLGLVENFRDIPAQMARSMAFLCRLQANTGLEQDNFYLPPVLDKQVGLGVIGLANILANHRISYEEFTTALEQVVNKVVPTTTAYKAVNLATQIYEGYQAAARVAKQHGMVRAFAVAPNASMSFRHRDSAGYTTAPNIEPPEDVEVERDSETTEPLVAFYPPNVQTKQDVAFSTYWRLGIAWQRMMNSTGLAHAMSFNVWSSQPVTREFIENYWLPSPLKTLYYRTPVDQQAFDKSRIVGHEDIEDLKDVYWGQLEQPEACGIQQDYCEACGG